MNDSKRLASMRTVSTHELQARQEAPSRIIREHEAGLLAELARQAHLAGHRFVGWPSLSTRQDPLTLGYGYGITLCAEVETVPS